MAAMQQLSSTPALKMAEARFREYFQWLSSSLSSMSRSKPRDQVQLRGAQHLDGRFELSQVAAMSTPSPRSELVWQLSEASVRGKAHVDGSLPNQDAVQVVTSVNGDVALRGGVRRSGDGSSVRRRVAGRWLTYIAARMCEFGRHQRGGPISLEAVREELELHISLVRSRLDPTDAGLRAFHCTFVMWLGTPGWFVSSHKLATVRPSPRGLRGQVSLPTNEPTSFRMVHAASTRLKEASTPTRRISSLRRTGSPTCAFTCFPPSPMLFVLMTDGAMDISTLKGKVFRGFLSNLVGGSCS